jgi:uncharacterized protein with HEPN domain
MPSRDPALRLRDIAENIALARGFLGDLDIDGLRSDVRTLYAVIRSLEIISEASRHLPTEMKDKFPIVPWPKIAGAGNIYRHEYQITRVDVIWETVKVGLDELERAVTKELG